jgi:hypothetical protein
MAAASRTELAPTCNPRRERRCRSEDPCQACALPQRLTARQNLVRHVVQERAWRPRRRIAWQEPRKRASDHLGPLQAILGPLLLNHLMTESGLPRPSSIAAT